jgi:hypothetical protein
VSGAISVTDFCCRIAPPQPPAPGFFLTLRFARPWTREAARHIGVARAIGEAHARMDALTTCAAYGWTFTRVGEDAWRTREDDVGTFLFLSLAVALDWARTRARRTS